MTIEDNAIVTLTYEVRDGGPSGALLERMDVQDPFRFMFGTGRMLPAWERRIFGLRPGMGFSFLLTPEDAYGRRSEDHILEAPIHIFHNERDQIAPDLLVRGQYITLTDSRGRDVNAKVLEWDEASVKLDANHALAGKTLFFSGAILEVRPPTVDELVGRRFIAEDGLRK